MSNATFRECAGVLGWDVDDKVVIHFETHPQHFSEDVYHVYMVVNVNLKEQNTSANDALPSK